ncbi:MAG: LacI family transcriptional regulator [Oscillospiraceae bacterium]|jgi:DNA-binding LacI/PurR family transcriptional regulator|nr:LacI family transcriptional regulator [Oscillospiraceae bacterium]
MDRTITIYDIAREAGVSSATVSRVLTGSSNVSQGKRESVLRLVDKYQFRPSTVARGLSLTRTHTIGLVVADIRNPYYAALAVEIEKAAGEIGLTVLLCNALNDRALEAKNLERLCGQRVEAIIQIGCSADDRETDRDYAALIRRVTRTTPYVTTSRIDGAPCGVVTIDCAEAVRQVFDLLVSLGHDRIALAGGRDNVRSTHEIFQHYLYFLGRHGLELREDYVLEGSYSQQGGYKCMRRLLETPCPPTAIIAINDYTAVGVLQAAAEQNVFAPRDFSLVSFDNTFLADIVRPRLTSVDYSYELFGSKLLNAALRMAERGAPDGIELIHPKLVVRDSCAAPKAVK